MRTLIDLSNLTPEEQAHLSDVDIETLDRFVDVRKCQKDENITCETCREIATKLGIKAQRR